MRTPAGFRTRGFTLVELLVVIAIIGLLSTLSVVAVSRARATAMIARAQGDVKQLATAIQLLSSDTGKWPNGCAIEGTANPEVNLTAQQAGITQAPTAGNQGSGCVWTTTDIATWNGPYMSAVNDPWGNPYYFDPDYTRYSDCAAQTGGVEVPAVVSFGPNEVGLNVYDCDNLIHELR